MPNQTVIHMSVSHSDSTTKENMKKGEPVTTNSLSLKRTLSENSCTKLTENETPQKRQKVLIETENMNINKIETENMNINKIETALLSEWNRPKDFNLDKSPGTSCLDKVESVSKEFENSGYENKTPIGSTASINGTSDGILSQAFSYDSKEVGAINNLNTNPSDVAVMDTDDDLEDDDNYLDSEPDDNIESYFPTNTEDEDTCCEDDQSVISTLTVGSTSSLRSIASETVGSVYMNENGVAANEDGSLLYAVTAALTPLPSLTPSLFPNVPVTINFCQYNEKTQDLPQDISRLLRWRFSTITPLIVKKTLINSGFKLVKKSLQWIGTWGKNPNATSFKTIKEFQKINHFPGAFQIGRKDKLWKNFARLQSKFGKEEFGFMPKTFVLPSDLKPLKTAFEKEGVKKKWIVKPPASARGTGIQVVNKWSQLPVNTPIVVQRYISRPYLINNTKFDIRLYVLVTSFHPLRIFLYEDGLVRFASVEYQKASKTLGDRFMHLTNYSVNKTSASYTPNDEAGQCQGHKWTLKTLWAYLKTQDVDTGALWSKIADLVIKTMICAEPEIIPRIRKGARSRYSCFEVFGFDVILDEKLRPWLLEVNISPSLHSASSLDHSVKGPLVSDLLNLVGFHIPDKFNKEQQAEFIKTIGVKCDTLCLDRRLYTKLLSTSEVAKHNMINSVPRNVYLSQILENLEPDDVRQLITVEDQLNRCGKFTCIFPTADTYQYFTFIDKPRYYNRLLDAWENTYGPCREKGIQLLAGYCKDQFHLQVPSRFKLPPKVLGTNRTSCGKDGNATKDTIPTKVTKRTTLVVNPLKPSVVLSPLHKSLIKRVRVSKSPETPELDTDSLEESVCSSTDAFVN